MSTEYEEKEIYVFLDFKGKVELNNFDEKHFLRVADLHTSNPLVQIDDMLYKGSYEDCVGTNLFFIEEVATGNKNCFEKESSVSLKYILSQNKIINLKCVKIKRIEETQPIENVEFHLNLNKDYATVLKKLSNGALKIDDLISDVNTEPGEQNATVEIENEQDLKLLEEEKILCEDSEEITIKEEDSPWMPQVDLEKELDQVPVEKDKKTQNTKLLQKYEKLQRLARRPVHREVQPEDLMQCEDRYKKQFEYHNIERQVLQRGDSFPVFDFNADDTVLQNFVDVDRCILHNVIPPLNRRHPIINDEDKKMVYKIDNFEFLSLPARLFVLENQLEQLEVFVKGAKKSELNKNDEFGRTPQDTLEMLNKLVTSLKVYLNTIKEHSVVSVDMN